MEKYFCTFCDYHTNRLSSFKDHMESKKHKRNVPVVCDKNIDCTEFKIKLSTCIICNVTYKENILETHKCDNSVIIENMLIIKNKEIKEYKEEIENLKKELNKKDAIIKEKDAEHNILLNKAMDNANYNSKTANATMNMLKYAQTYLNDVEPLIGIDSDNIEEIMNYENPKNEININETYVKTIIHTVTHGIFPDFIGDMIIKKFKPISPNKRNILMTDLARLCFIIMQQIKGKKKEWINDKSGERFISLILDPMLIFVKKLINNYCEFYQKKENEKLLTEKNLRLMTKCAELSRDIDVKKFINQF